MSDTERQIDDAIEQSANPLAGEQAEPVRPPDEPAPDEQTEPSGWSPPVPERSDAPAPPAEPADEEKTTEFEPPTATPPAEAEGSTADEKPAESEDKKDDGGSDWRTWSGRSINP
jgi:hypothetical protein